jgi:hypothetical protein
LREAKEGDALLAVSVKPYTRAAIELVDYAAAKGLEVVAITDSVVSPLVARARAAIVVPTESPSFFHTMTPAFAVAEALAAMLAEARTARQKTVVAGRLDEAAISRLPLGLIDMIAVRGAACRGSREAPVCRRRVAALRERLARHDDCCASSLRKTGNYFLAHGPCIACRFFRHAQDFLDTGFRCGILTGSACSRDNKGGGNCARALVGAAICSVVYLYHHARGDT